MANEPLIITLDAAQAERLFGRLIAKGADLTGLMAQLGEDLTESSQARFDTGIGPDGIAWQELADGSGRTPLNLTHRMRDGIHPQSGPDWVEIRADARQARWHQEGTKSYEIRPKNGKALAFGVQASRLGGKNHGAVGPAHVVTKVNHPGLPARPFIGFSAEDAAAAERLTVAWLELDEGA